MALKGTTRIELTNVRTGEKEVIEKDNLVTNAVGDILQMNPYGLRFRDYQTNFHPANEKSSAITSKYFGKQFLPMCPNLFGGILLYEKTLEEDPEKYFAPMDNLLVGYSSNTVNSETDTKRGSMNQTESGPLDDGTGYRFVFDFSTSQGNGTIASLGLTSKMGGVGGYGSMVDTYNNFVFPVDVLSDLTNSWTSSYARRMRSVVSLDPDNNAVIYAYVSGPNTITLGKHKFPLTTLGLRDNFDSVPDNIDGSETIIVTETFATVINSDYGTFYGTLIDGGDGYIWGFQHEGNAKGNSDGSATILWVKISKEDWSFEEGTMTVDAQLEKFGFYNTGTGKYNNVGEEYNNLIIKDGVLYAIKYATSENYMPGVYLIPLENPTNVTLLEFEDGSSRYFRTYYSGSSSYYYYYTNVNIINGVIRYRYAYINGGQLHKANGNIESSTSSYGLQCLSGNAKPGLTYGPFIFGIGGYYYYSDFYHRVYTYIQSCYLATINNLATPVQKTADKTMKITYILREE